MQLVALCLMNYQYHQSVYTVTESDVKPCLTEPMFKLDLDTGDSHTIYKFI